MDPKKREKERKREEKKEEKQEKKRQKKMNSFGVRFATKLVENMEVRINRIHIRYPQ